MRSLLLLLLHLSGGQLTHDSMALRGSHTSPRTDLGNCARAAATKTAGGIYDAQIDAGRNGIAHESGALDDVRTIISFKWRSA